MDWLQTLKNVASGSSAGPVSSSGPEASTPPDAQPDKAEEPSPYENMWEQQKPPDPVSLAATLTPDKLQALAEGQRFSQVLPPEMLEGVNPQALDALGQAVYKATMQHQSTLVDSLVTERLKASEADIAKRVKQEMVKAETRRNVELPKEAEPVVNMVSAQLAQTHPNASPEWIAEQSRAYFLNVARQVNPEAFEPPAQSVRKSSSGKPNFPSGARESEPLSNEEAGKGAPNWAEWLAKDDPLT